jgi:protein ImuA
MSTPSTGKPGGIRETVPDLRIRLGLFSFQERARAFELAVEDGRSPDLGLRPGGTVEWLAATPGAGAVTSAMLMMSQLSHGHKVLAIVDSERECYAPALAGWDIDPGRTLLVRPAARQEACWAIEQCLRCPGVAATCAWLDRRIPMRVHRRWQLAAEAGGGVGFFFRPASARREPAWADLRLMVTPRPGGQGEARRVRIDVLYRRGGLGGAARTWEIDHAAGAVRLVPEVADPTTAERAARS